MDSGCLLYKREVGISPNHLRCQQPTTATNKDDIKEHVPVHVPIHRSIREVAGVEEKEADDGKDERIGLGCHSSGQRA